MGRLAKDRHTTLDTMKRLFISVCLVTAFSGIAAGELTRIEITSKQTVGSYERIMGTAYFAVDPKLPQNRAITDIGIAPVNSQGKVEFWGDVMVLRPLAAAKSRGAVFLEVVNRGEPQAFGVMSGAAFGDPAPEHWDVGDGFLLEQGFTVAFLGWQFDVQKGRGLTFHAPTVPVTGLVRDSAIEIAGGRDSGFPLTYCASDPEEKDAQVTFRLKIDEPGQTLDREHWHFGRNGCTVLVDGGLTPGLYEAVYRAKDPALAGLGMAAIRDFAAYLKNGRARGPLRENPGSLKRVIGYGYSQSARFLRQFVRDGFNQDERGHMAFDGLMISSAGAGGGSFNHRFAMPGQAGNSVLSILRPVDLPPFTDDGLLAKAQAAHTTPRIFYTFTSTEYWARAGSLTHTSAAGKRDFPLGAKSRLYFLPGTAHAIGPFPPVRGQNLHYVNFAQQEWVDRALLLDLDAWIDQGVSPPPSRYPAVAKGELVPLESVAFPKIPRLAFPKYMPQVWPMNYGPEFLTKGIIANEPPALGPPYTVLVPQVDADGNDLGGVRLPEVVAPLGTFTGWNISVPQIESLHYLDGLLGSFEPLPKTLAERERSGDSRRSIAERYASRKDYLNRVERTASDLVQQRFMLAGDIPEMLRRAEQMWDAFAGD
jgi:hypothetical protein